MVIYMSKRSFGAGTLLAPVPVVLVSCGTFAEPNVMTAAWTGIVCSDPAKTYVSLRPERFSHELITRTGDFVINLPSASLTRITDMCGVLSGRKINKFEYCHLTRESCEHVTASAVGECPVILECRVSQKLPLGSHDMFIADILNVSVNEDLIDDNGKIMFDRADLITYSHGEYFRLGEKLGKFGYSVKKR